MTPEQLTQEVEQLEVLSQNHQYEQAEIEAKALLKQPLLEVEQELHIRTLLVLTESLFYRGLNKNSLPIALQALALSENYPNKELFVKALNNIGIVYDNLSDYPKAVEYYHRALTIHEKMGNKDGVAKTANNIGNAYIHLSDYQSALKYHHRALTINKEIGNKEDEANTTNSIGIVYYHLSDYTKALEYYDRALMLNEEMGNKKRMANATTNIGILYNSLSDYPKALDYLQRPLTINKEIGNKVGLAIPTNSIGIVYYHLSDYTKALEYYDRASMLFEEMGNKVGIASATTNIGIVYQDLSNYPKSLEYYHCALTLHEEIGNKRGVAITIDYIGNMYADERFEGYDYIKAETYLLKANALCKELGIIELQRNNEKILSDLYKKLNRWEECYRHFEKFYELEKELQIEEVKKQADRLDFERQEAEREKQRAVAQAKHEATEQLLHNVLPPDIAHRMLGGDTLIAEKLPAVSVLFADIVGFTRLSQRITPDQLVQGLDLIFTEFDALAEKHGLEKIKTIGDCYMVVSGAPKAREDHAQAIALFALEMQEAIKKFKAIATGEQIQMRIGIHTGEAVAGVIGKKKFAYDLWGDTVNTASRMESHGEAGKIHVSEDFAEVLKNTAFQFTKRGQLEVKGKGTMSTYFMEEQLNN